MIFQKRTLVVAVAAAFVASLAAPSPSRAGAEDILKLIPSDAWGFAYLGSLQRVDEKAELLNKTLGLQIPTPVTAMMLAPMGLGESIDLTAPVCAVMMDVQKFGGPQQSAVLMVTAKDAKGMLANLQGEEQEDGMFKCMVMGEPAFASVKDNIVVLGPSKECVTEVARSKKTMGASFAKCRINALKKSDVFISVSMSAVVGAYKDMFLPMVQMMMAAQDPEGKQVNVLVKVLTETEALDLSFLFDDGGLSLKFLMAPKKDSDFEKLMADEKTTSDSLVGLLPKEKFLLTFGGIAAHSKHEEKFAAGGGLTDLIKMSGMEGIDEKAVERLKVAVNELTESIQQYAISFSSLPDGAEGMIGMAMVARTDDSAEFVKGVRDAYETIWKVTDDEDVSSIKEGISHTPDAETVGGHKVDTIKVDLEKLAEIGEADEQELAKAQSVLGKECVLRFGQAGSNHVVFALGGGKARFESICKAAASSDGLSSDKGISSVSESLPTPRASEFYIAVDNVLQCVNMIAKSIGEEALPVEIPTVDSPLAGAGTVEDNVMRVELLVPMKLIKAGKEVFDSYTAASDSEDFDEFEEADEEADEEGDGGDDESGGDPEDDGGE
jgi:hypothetical protein